MTRLTSKSSENAGKNCSLNTKLLAIIAQIASLENEAMNACTYQTCGTLISKFKLIGSKTTG